MEYYGESDEYEEIVYFRREVVIAPQSEGPYVPLWPQKSVYCLSFSYKANKYNYILYCEQSLASNISCSDLLML